MSDTILVIAPHCDDETLGMGGTIARLAHEGNRVVVAVMTGHGDERPHPLWPPELWKTIRGEASEAFELLGVSQVVFREIPAVTVGDQPLWQLNRVTQEVVQEFNPVRLYVPFPFDLHRDHRELFHSLSLTWRPHSELGRGIREVCCYEVVSETHLNIPYAEAAFTPQIWVDISDFLRLKLDALRCYRSQMRPSPDLRSLQTVEALARLRGAQMGVAAAEAFVTVRRFV